MAKSLWALVGATLLVAACGEPPPSGTEDVLFLRKPGGAVVVAAGGSAPRLEAEGVPTVNWNTVVSTRRAAGATEVLALDPTSSAERWSEQLEGRLTAKVVSTAGDLVALSPQRQRHYSEGRTSTNLIVAGRTFAPRTYELEGNFEPEAFTTDGATLFVVEYSPARRPSHYQVRRLDLAGGEVGDVYSVDTELQERMRGTARIQTMSPDGGRLYTLYTLRSAGNAYAFIHVLSLDEKWAHCVDLPSGFASAEDRTTTLSVTPDGKRLFVANAASGEIAEVDTEALRHVRTSEIEFGMSGPLHAAAAADDRLYLASGIGVTAVDTASLTKRTTWFMDEKVSGVQVAADGRKLFVGLHDRVAILHPDSGEQTGSVDPPGIGRIGELGLTTRPFEEERSTFSCAC